MRRGERPEVTRARIHKLLNAFIDAQVANERAQHVANFATLTGPDAVLERQALQRAASVAYKATHPAQAALLVAVRDLSLEELRAWQATWDETPPVTGATA